MSNVCTTTVNIHGDAEKMERLFSLIKKGEYLDSFFKRNNIEGEADGYIVFVDEAWNNIEIQTKNSPSYKTIVALAKWADVKFCAYAEEPSSETYEVYDPDGFGDFAEIKYHLSWYLKGTDANDALGLGNLEWYEHEFDEKSLLEMVADVSGVEKIENAESGLKILLGMRKDKDSQIILTEIVNVAA
ncbi:MAG: hypothetical protein K6F27_09695 [Ruminococcus sp.]|nr:hypothetical protein [Ruminococcus sp.]